MTQNESTSPAPEPQVQPSSTPDGPQVIPAPSTPEGEPGPDPEPGTDVRDSNPNAASEPGLGGGMGVSSERLPEDPESIEGTGSRGTATVRADGSWPTLAASGGNPGDEDGGDETDDRPHPQEPAEGPEMDDRQQEATQEWRDDQPPAQAAASPSGSGTGDNSWRGIDRTVGEFNPATVPSHPFDRTKNPGHSHG